MKKLSKFFVTLLVVTLTMSCYTSVFADSLSKTDKKLVVNSRIIGNYPEVKDISGDINKEIVSYVNKLRIDLGRISDFGMRQLRSDIISYSTEEDGDYTILTISLAPIKGVILTSDKNYEGKVFYIDMANKKLSTKADYETYLEELEAAELAAAEEAAAAEAAEDEEAVDGEEEAEDAEEEAAE